MWVDERWREKFSRFLRNKSDIATVGKQLIEELKDKYNITVKVIRCDNMVENKSLEKELSGKNIKFEYTASGTPQQNGVVERAFATLYNRIRSMMYSAGIGKEMRKKLWAECAQTAILIDNLLIYNGNKSFYDRLGTEQPRFILNMRQFGEVGIVLNQKIRNISSKMDNKGLTCIFTGYSLQHRTGVYRMFNLQTQKNYCDERYFMNEFDIWTIH